MPDDAIEREHWSRQSIAGIVIQAIVASRSGKGMALPAGRAADEILTLLSPAFASQQAPGMVSIDKAALKVLLPPGSCEQQYLDGWCDGQTYLIGNIVGWSAMLDAAPSVTITGDQA